MYRNGVGAVILNNNKNVLIARRIDIKNAWQLPQGGIEQGESPQEAIFREMKEEIGTNNFTIIDQTLPLSYKLPQENQKSFFSGKYLGQKQIWFYLKFLGKNTDINLTTTSPQEFDDWQWVDMKIALELIVDFKKDMYQQIYDYGQKKNLFNNNQN